MEDKLMKSCFQSVLMGMVCLMAASSMAGKFDHLYEKYNATTGIVYKTVSGESLDMAIFFPSEKKYEKTPVMLYTHGGGWGGGDKSKIFTPSSRGTLETLLDNGIAVATIEYRLTRSGVSTAEDCVVDCKDAARFLVKHADEYGLDPARMGTWGGSAGGHLCLMTALAPDDLFSGDEGLAGYTPTYRCIATYFPATTFLVPEVLVGSNFENPGRFISFLGGPYDENMDLVRKLSPVGYLSDSTPPVLVMHGDKDQVLSYRNATYMMEVAKERNADVELLTVTNALHGFAGENVQPSVKEINRICAEFIIKHLTAPRVE